ncbi:MAG: carboxylating nicotinate-nucleotide diphosphorylase [Sulfolobaceae archaeon]
MLEAIVKRKLLEYLEEDIYPEDLTSRLLFENEEIKSRAKIIFKENGVVAGLKFVNIILKELGLKIISQKKDGEKIEKGEVVLSYEGNAYEILSSERVILNLISRLSGIATITRNMVDRAKKVNPKVVIAATRKTTPGFRLFEKYAVEVGGGDTHRYNLYDMILIKDNHISIIGDIEKAIERIRKKVSFTKKIEVEVSNLEDALRAYKAGADILLLDNMKPQEIEEVVKHLKGKVLLEASGRITPENVEEYAKTGVDIISSGYITHSVKSIDVSLDIEKL